MAMDEARWLAAAGHQVAHYAAAHPENDSSDWSAYFPPYIELGPNSELGLAAKSLAVGRLFYNGPARRSFGRLLEDFCPDVIHIHGIHRQISPSILREALRLQIPVVQTLHDYHHICPSGDLLQGGRVVCIPRACGNYWTCPAVAHRCSRGSVAVSMLLAMEMSYANTGGIYERAVRRFISPSRFLADVVRTAQWTNRPIDVIPNATDMTSLGQRSGPGDTFVYIGRLSREKGLPGLIQAASETGVPLAIAGTGPDEALLRSLSAPNISFLGRIGGAEVGELLTRARAAVLPSTCLENLPMSIIEARALGVPVIATDMGGIPELVSHGSDGLIYPAGDAHALGGALRRLWEDPGYAERMGATAAARSHAIHDPLAHVSRLEEVYRLAMGTGA